MATFAAGTYGSAPRLDPKVRVQLSIMMFLNFAIWGSWFTVLGNRLGALGLSDSIGSIFGTMALGTIFAPIFIGQIADRYFSSEKLLGLLHLAGAGLLYYMSTLGGPGPVPDGANEAIKADYAALAASASTTFWWVALAYALVYSPTIALTSSITFSHVPDGQRDFPSVRVLGTVGWIAAGLGVDYVLRFFTATPQTSEFPFLMAAVLSAVLGVYSFFLPKTPPRGKAGDALPFVRAFSLLKIPSFAVFFAASFAITIVLAFYYNYTGVYLEKVHGYEKVATTMTLGQGSELVLLFLLPWFLIRFGMKAVLAVGMLAWGVRYLLFAFAPTAPASFIDPMVLIGVALHGVCFDFFFAAGFIHVDKTAPRDIRGSAQALFVFLTYGVAMYLGSELSNVLANVYMPKDGVPDWQTFWLLPAIGVLVVFVVFLVGFRESPNEAARPDLAA